jgi:hypothetical protein
MTVSQATLPVYLTEIRKRVCSRCVERPPGGPPCEPLGKNCGVEMHLPALVDSIHQVHSDLLKPYLDHNRKEICDKCAFLHSSICPCPMDYLSALVVEAVEAVDQCLEREAGKSRLPPPPPGGLEEVRQAYQEGTGTWVGCDWPTQFGQTGLDLNGWEAATARLMAEKSHGDMAEDWVAAARWLAQVEEHAKRAEARAAAAVGAAEAGRWREAVQFAEQAWALEFGTGRAIWHSFPLAWQKLLAATEAAFLAHRS